MKTIVKSTSTNSLSSIYSDCSDTTDKKIYLIYNENNILITRNIIQKILKKRGITDKIMDLKIWQKAFTNKSYSKNLKKKKEMINIFINQIQIRMLTLIMLFQFKKNQMKL